jgi:DNA invertase Pin-like site-specific DNA recombinase
MAEMELIRERQRAGIDKAKAEGRYKGRPVTVDHRKVMEMIGRGVSAADVAKAAGCSRAAVYKILVQHEQDAARGVTA